MKFGRQLAACVLSCVATVAYCDPDPSFVLSTTSVAVDSYFPTYLANGYLSTMTGARGTESNLAYLVAFMDYTKEDIARPAAIPGWSGIDYSTGKSSAGEFWLNNVKLGPQAFAGYRQTLDMYDGTLTTSYRYTDDSKKSTDVRVVTFASQAAPHLAAAQLSITPAFTGTVQLQFWFTLWAPHQPRFPIRTMNGEEMQAAVAANAMNVLEPLNHATPDRAPVWYYGHTAVLAPGADAHALSFWLDGKAEQGLTMAQAAAIGLPADLQPSAVKVIRNSYQLGLLISVPVQQGRTYSFTKYVAVSRQGWGGNAQATLAMAQQARQQGFEQLLAAHQAAWHELWKSDIVVDGDAHAQQALHSDLYYLLSNSMVGTAWPMGACALTPNYAYHAFWDSDSWVFPALLLLHPERAKPIVMFRHRTMEPARARARQYGAKGTMYPWEADPETGVDHTPYFAYGVYREIHVNADIAIAQWQYYLATGDEAWLKSYGWPVIREIADFWVSRVTFNKEQNRYEIHHVTSPDEAYDDVPNDSFTNAAARKALDIAVAAAQRVGAAPDPQWAAIASHMYIPFSEKEQRHLDFDASVPHDKVTWMGSSLSWLAYPNLDLPMSPQVRRNDFEFQLQELKVHGNDPNEMMMVMLAVHAAELGQGDVAGEWIDRNLVGFLKAPFNVRSETAANNAGYILATSAGFVQSFVYGLTGLRINDEGLSQTYAPVLPAKWKSLTLKNVAFRGQHFDVVVGRDAAGKVRLTRQTR
ncbi:MAG: glycosyl hydrolase family 95 catalytic domain-containing protein [Steroidobacterales bacterium]|jgi:trehalose/maltose hydrolase-like predicted phosphorylase